MKTDHLIAYGLHLFRIMKMPANAENFSQRLQAKICYLAAYGIGECRL